MGKKEKRKGEFVAEKLGRREDRVRI